MGRKNSCLGSCLPLIVTLVGAVVGLALVGLAIALSPYICAVGAIGFALFAIIAGVIKAITGH